MLLSIYKIRIVSLFLKIMNFRGFILTSNQFSYYRATVTFLHTFHKQFSKNHWQTGRKKWSLHKNIDSIMKIHSVSATSHL